MTVTKLKAEQPVLISMVEKSREEMDMQEIIYLQGFWHPKTTFTS